MVTHPTVVVGVGQAGVNVLSKIHEVAQEDDDDEMFKFIALDTDKDTLNNAPTGTSTTTLSLDDDFLQEDVGKYPYLTERMNIRGSGAKRQRPVGRYKLDRRGDGGFDDVFSNLSEEIGAHYEEHKVKLHPDTASFNIFFIHSFGGGTGSGSYPLILSILDRIASDQLDAVDEVVYLAGVGVVPEITFDPEHADPPGESHDYYPNAYAAFSDLDKFTGVHGSPTDDDDDGPLNLPLWSRTIGKVGDSNIEDGKLNTFEFTSVPFDDYWLVGVNEGKIGGLSVGHAGPESYREELNQTMARSIHSVSKLDQSAENWANASPFTGTFDQAEVSVPHDQVRSLVDAKKERKEKRESINTDIPDEISDHEARIRELEDLKRNLDPEDYIDDDDLKTEIRSYLEDEGFRGGAYIVENKKPDNIRDVLAGLEERYQIEALIIATESLRDRLQEERGAPAVEEEWKETVQNLWKKYDMQGQSEYGASGIRTLEGKAGVLEEYLNDQIDQFVEIKENWSPSLIGQIRDIAPPIMDALESDREYAERWLATLQDDYSALEQAIGEWDRVSRMLEAVEDSRADIRSKIDDRIDDINGEITELQNELDKLESELRSLNNDIDGLRDSITEEKTSERIAILPIKEDRVDDIDEVILENDLTSLLAYVEKGYVAEDKLRYALNQRLNFVEAWNANIVERNFDGTNDSRNFSESNEVWYLFHEANRDFTDYITDRPSADEEFSGEEGQSKLQYLNDPHRIKYIAYTRRGPISAFETYQAFETLEEEGWLEQYANQYPNYLQAFAYLEWYGREVEEAFQVRRLIEVPRPPELEVERVDKPDLDTAELKNYVKTNGLDTYLWEGNLWGDYNPGDERFRGWKDQLSKNGISYTDIQRATPDSRLKGEWLAEQRDWDDIVDAYKQNIIDQNETKIVYKDE